MIPGKELTFGDRKLVIPPLSLGALELLQDRLTQLGQGSPTDPATTRTVVDAAHAALKRNYPQMTREEVADLVDLRNMGEVIQAVINGSGLGTAAAGLGETRPQADPAAAG